MKSNENKSYIINTFKISQFCKNFKPFTTWLEEALHSILPYDLSQNNLKLFGTICPISNLYSFIWVRHMSQKKYIVKWHFFRWSYTCQVKWYRSLYDWLNAVYMEKNNVRLLLKNGWVRAFDGHQQIAEGTIDVFASALSGTTSIFSFLFNAVRPRGFLWSKEIICATLP